MKGFVGGPLSVGGLGPGPLPLPLNPALRILHMLRKLLVTTLQQWIRTANNWRSNREQFPYTIPECGYHSHARRPAELTEAEVKNTVRYQNTIRIYFAQ